MTPDFSYISEFIKKYRQTHSLSLDELAQVSRVSRSMICQIEGGKTTPTIQVLWRLAKAMGVSLGELVDPSDRPEIYRLTHKSQCKAVKSFDGSFTCFRLASESPNRNVEIHLFSFQISGQHTSPGHAKGATEYIVMEKGRMKLEVGGEKIALKSGDIVEFRGSLEHTYKQEGEELARGTIFIHYR